jgi:hypothetical protein
MSVMMAGCANFYRVRSLPISIVTATTELRDRKEELIVDLYLDGAIEKVRSGDFSLPQEGLKS